MKITALSFCCILPFLAGCATSKIAEKDYIWKGSSVTSHEKWTYTLFSWNALLNSTSFNKNNFSVSEDDVNDLAKKGWTLVFNIDDKFKSLLFKRRDLGGSSEFKVIGGCRIDNEDSLNDWGAQGFELVSVRNQKQTFCGFQKPLNSDKTKRWRYKVIPDCQPNDQLEELREEARSGWTLVCNGSNGLSRSVCVLKKPETENQNHQMLMLSPCPIEDIKNLNQLGSLGWEILGHFYNSGDYCLIQRTVN